MMLLVIGYSFSDPHINSIINDGIDNHGLRVWVWDYLDWPSWDQYIKCHVDGHAFRSTIERYINEPFQSVFGGHPSSTLDFGADLNEFLGV
ncbi:hypothetical protein CCB80_11105 [Armatimonadetes bacterium Uphvl-Ar1]|nr:hypothetical protein CCB80_11105 [Armatimonadetes bacterium Uphvl-Ar1]